MVRQAKDDAREERIKRDILGDATGPQEQALAWYAYLKDTLRFPFLARCVARRAISPIEPGAELEILSIAPAEECRHEMFVLTRWRPHALAIPLMQVEGIHADEATYRAIEDWRYWVSRGSTLST